MKCYKVLYRLDYSYMTYTLSSLYCDTTTEGWYYVYKSGDVNHCCLCNWEGNFYKRIKTKPFTTWAKCKITIGKKKSPTNHRMYYCWKMYHPSRRQI